MPGLIRRRRAAALLMILGSPAKAVRQLSPEQIEGLKMSAKHYVDNARRYKTGLKKVG